MLSTIKAERYQKVIYFWEGGQHKTTGTFDKFQLCGKESLVTGKKDC